jgi:fumarylacetoacetase
MTDHTHDPSLISWLESANDAATDFPIQNLPFGIFASAGTSASVGVAIGDRILDVTACLDAGLIEGDAIAAAEACRSTSLNGLMALGRAPVSSLRRALSGLLARGANAADRVRHTLRDASTCEMQLPAKIGDYTDFYASIHHATNVGRMFRPDNPLLPNYKWVPIGYHGRASSIVVSGTPVRRPLGQTRDGESPPTYGPTKRLDYELEMGVFIGQGNTLGSTIAVDAADAHMFGLCLVNDWSARDVQTWEYQPLGPFLAKSFATTISPWVVTLDALEPFRVAAAERPEGDPEPLAYLASSRDDAFAISLEVSLRSAKMRDAGVAPFVLSRGSFRDMYWTFRQLVTHHASNGCNLRPGDLLASGTVSGPTKESRGCLLERAARGTEPVELPSGEMRSFLQDGDELTMRAFCEAPSARRIGFGPCVGRVVPANT